jgi:hypothetical protein
MAEREDLELERRTAPKGGEKCGQKGGQEVPEGESKEKGQLSVYQSDQSLQVTAGCSTPRSAHAKAQLKNDRTNVGSFDRADRSCLGASHLLTRAAFDHGSE